MNGDNKNSTVIQYNGESFIRYEEYKTWVDAFDDVSNAYEKQSKEFQELKDKNNSDVPLKVCILAICVASIIISFIRSEYLVILILLLIPVITIYSLIKINNILD